MKINCRFFILIILIISFSSKASAFDENVDDVRNLPVKERFFLGISAGLSFSSFETSVVVSPTLGFRFSNRFIAGIGGTYQYYYDKSFGNIFSTHIYGGGVFSRFLIIPQAFIHGEVESLNMLSRDQLSHGPHRIWEYNYFLGAGYRLQVGRNVFFNLMLLYNFNKNSRIYFQNPIFRFNVEFGL